MKIHAIPLLILAFFLLNAQSRDSDLMENLTFRTSFGTTLKYLLFIPGNYDASGEYPLVVTLRATGSDYIYQVDNNDQAHPWIEDSVQARWPHFIMAPECPGSTWGGMMGAGTELSQECRAVIEAIEDLKKKYSLDTTRFIIGGFSLGGAGTYHMIQFLPDYWSAACPVGAGGSADAIDVISRTPVWHHQGLNDNNGAALTRMADALENHDYPVLRITNNMVVNSPSGWNNEIKKGTRPEDIIFKNAKPSYDSIRKAVDSGEMYIYQLITGASHEDSRLNANHNPLLAKWAFMQRKGDTSTTAITRESKTNAVGARSYGTVLTFGRSLNIDTRGTFNLAGRKSPGIGVGMKTVAPLLQIRKADKENSGSNK
jgi:poly(3-hydroxybutyrate) depolymerase